MRLGMDVVHRRDRKLRQSLRSAIGRDLAGKGSRKRDAEQATAEQQRLSGAKSRPGLLRVAIETLAIAKVGGRRAEAMR